MTSPQVSDAEESIDFGALLASLRRQWLLVAAFGAGGALTAAVLTARTPRIWEADFQIVLSEDKGGSGLSGLLSQGGGLAALLGGAGGLAGGASSQETELKVLLSPSVLLPVFEYVKSREPAAIARGMRFRGWAGAVKAKAEKNTSVLNVTYSGTDPQLVLAASRKLAETYQSYSGRKRQRSLLALISYLQEQIGTYRNRAQASRDRAEAWANRYTLTAADAQATSGGAIQVGGGLGGQLSNLFSGIASNLQVGHSGSIRTQQSELRRRIRDLQYQRQRVLAAGDRVPINYSNGGGAGLLSPLLGNLGSNTASLQELDRTIAERRSRFQDNDPTIVQLQRQRRVLIGSLNRQLVQELDNAIDLAQSQLSSLERPPGVLETFQKLSRTANQDETVLANLETNLEQQKLELARGSQPWDLISEPMLSDRPVSPRPLRNLALGLVAGLVGGAGAALLRERRSGLVFHQEDLLELLPYPLLGQLNSGHSERWSGVLDLLAHGPLQSCPQVALIPVGAIDDAAQQLAGALQQTLQHQDPAAQVLLSRDLLQASRCQAQLLVAMLGLAERDATAQLQQDLQLQGKPVAGLLLLSAPQAGDDA